MVRSREKSGVRAPPGWTAAAARDRLSATLFCAALLHGIVILGVTFTADPPRRDPSPTSLDVVIVTRDYEARTAPQNPALLAEQSLVGRGNAPLSARLRTAVTGSPEPAPPGPDQDGSLIDPLALGPPTPAVERLAALGDAQSEVLPGKAGETAEQARQRLIEGVPLRNELFASPDTVTVIPDANPRVLVVSANTRESRMATYLNNWKIKVERIGTLNFPNAAALSTITSYPVLEVAIKANGELHEVVVVTSSGYPNLDQAAMEILRIAAPFEPFPGVLRDNYDVLRFAYEWRFGASQIRTVRAARAD